MAGGCCGGSPDNGGKADDRVWRRVLWIALIINAGMFAVEIIAGVTAGSASLKADALDFLGDAANYAISLGVAGLALRWRARAALAKGISLLLLGVWVVTSTAWMAAKGTLPTAETMGIIGVLALVANLICAVMLWRQHRAGGFAGVHGWLPRLGILVLLQVALGIATLLSSVPISLAVGHQALAFMLAGVTMAYIADMRRSTH